MGVNEANTTGVELAYFDELSDLIGFRHGKLWEKFKRCQRQFPIMEPAEGEFRYDVGVHGDSS